MLQIIWILHKWFLVAKNRLRYRRALASDTFALWLGLASPDLGSSSVAEGAQLTAKGSQRRSFGSTPTCRESLPSGSELKAKLSGKMKRFSMCHSGSPGARTTTGLAFHIREIWNLIQAKNLQNLSQESRIRDKMINFARRCYVSKTEVNAKASSREIWQKSAEFYSVFARRLLG